MTNDVSREQALEALNRTKASVKNNVDTVWVRDAMVHDLETIRQALQRPETAPVDVEKIKADLGKKIIGDDDGDSPDYWIGIVIDELVKQGHLREDDNGWKSIESAPKETVEYYAHGLPIQLLVKYHDCTAIVHAYWDNDPQWWQIDTGGKYEFCAVEGEILGWRHSPTPPKEQA